MRIGLLKYPGGHGEAELLHVLSTELNADVRTIWYKESMPSDIDLMIIGGGFPCLDHKPKKHCLDESPVIASLGDFVKGGKFVLGVGNGFRLLCEQGLLPGRLDKNLSGNFICKYVFIKADNRHSVLTGALKQDDVFRIPVSTLFGKYYADEETLVNMRQDGQILFRYCNYEGRITEAVNFTGSLDNIAVICNKNKNIFGMIPQPERAVSTFVTDNDGKEILASFLSEIPYGS